MHKQPDYISQLDGLRAIAIALVIIFHWFPEGEGINRIANGPLGVTLFFVLSGFLITRILLANRSYLGEQGFTGVYKNFMIRRMLRIFPLYYLTLLLVWLVQYVPFIPKISTQLYSNPLYYVLYLSNFLIEKLHDWSDVLSPFWSLAVEEQFYILWPVVMLITPSLYLKRVIISTIFLGVASRLVFFVYSLDEGVLMPTCLDAFGLGALWAYVLYYNNAPEKFLRILKIAALPALLLFVIICFGYGGIMLKTILFRTSMSVFCLYLVATASYGSGFKSIFGKILNTSPLKYIGKVSYGLYVYHMLVPALVIPLIVKLAGRFLHIELTVNGFTGVLFAFVVLMVVASLSWYCFEAPFNNLKRFFQLKRNK
jgi:peptidoglycan/LPS O-acetylase OafA/YrhL